MDRMICAICHDHIDKELHRNHCECKLQFHTKCVERWFDTIKSRTCPVCRRTSGRVYHNKQNKYFTEIVCDKIVDPLDLLISWVLDRVNHPIGIIGLVFHIIYIALSFAITILILVPLGILYVAESMLLPRIIDYWQSDDFVSDDFVSDDFVSDDFVETSTS